MFSRHVTDVRYVTQHVPGSPIGGVDGTHVSLKTPHFDPFFRKIPGFFSVSDKSILTSEMDVINYSEFGHVIIFFKTL